MNNNCSSYANNYKRTVIEKMFILFYSNISKIKNINTETFIAVFKGERERLINWLNK